MVWCCVKVCLRVKLILQTSHLCGLIPVWILAWRTREPLSTNDFWQISQVWSFLPVWRRLCSLSPQACLKLLPQISQWNGLSSVWVLQNKIVEVNCFAFILQGDVLLACIEWDKGYYLTWPSSSCFILNDLSHCWHLKGLSSLWTSWCRIKDPLSLKPFPHVAHLNFFSATWTLSTWVCRNKRLI